MTEQEPVRQYIADGVCPWHPIHELPCPICYLRSFDSRAEKDRRNPKPGKGLYNETSAEPAAREEYRCFRIG